VPTTSQERDVHCSRRPKRSQHLWGVSVRVKVRAVVPWRDGVVVARERRLGEEHLSLPGGRLKRRETLADALTREVAEETGVDITVGPLLYVAEVVGGVVVHELNLVFLAECDTVGDDVLLLRRGDPDRARVMPAILDTVFGDLEQGWADTPRFLGNLYAPGLGSA
jgi:ADP-ribose pyrophosphatase YjhB (NUDIX family)